MQQLARETIPVPESTQASSPAECSAQLLEVTPAIMRHIRSEMRRRTMPGLSVPQFRTLNYLRNHSGASLSDVAESQGLTLPSASKLVQKLVSQKVVARRAANDRRRVCLSLTERGLTALALARQETHQQLAENLQALSTEELATVSAALRILDQAFTQGGADVHLR